MYYQCIRTCPSLWIVTTFSVCLGLFSYSIYRNELPSFEDPLVGFEVRNSELSTRLNTWRLLSESTALNGLLSLYPKPYKSISSPTSTSVTTTSESPPTTSEQSPKQKKSRKTKGGKHRNGTRKRVKTDNYDPFRSKSHQLEENKSFFCGNLLEEYVHFVLKANNKEINLLQPEPLRDICYLDKTVFRMESGHFKVPENTSNKDSHFKHYCEVKNGDQQCCPSWSLPNFVLFHSNKTDCDAIDQTDIDAFVKLLRFCASFYADNYLNEDCATDPSQCSNVPEQCYSRQNLVFNVFNYLVDYEFFEIRDQILNRNETLLLDNYTTNYPFLRSTSVFLPMAKSSKLIDYYRTISNSQFHFNLSSNPTTIFTTDLAFGTVRVVAADLGLKNTLFSKSLISDLVLIIMSSLIIFGSLLLYTQSLLLTITAMLTIFASLTSAYFIYTEILVIKFFPFLNLLSVIILIGIGSDNALIYCKSWCCVMSSSQTTNFKSKTNRRHHHNHQEYHQQMGEAFNHVFVSALCASLTTCCAFFAGYFTDITSLKCFSIFAGVSIVTNFVITIITFPASMLLSESISDVCGGWFSNQMNNKICSRIECLSTGFSRLLFNQIILKLVFNYRHLISIFFTGIALASGFVVLYKPGLKLPTTQEFQVFSSNHLFEKFDLKYRNEFWFSRLSSRIASPIVTAENSMNPTSTTTMNQLSNVVFPIRVVFGILPVDNGDYLNPFERGHLVFDPEFNISSPESQVWLLDFCRNIRLQSFYRPIIGPLLTNCFIETFKQWMENRRCVEEVGGERVDRFPCCEQTKFPYQTDVFSQCLVEVVERLHQTPNYLFNMNRAGPRFNSSEVGTVKAVVIEFDSVYDAFNTSYDQMKHLWSTIDGWVQIQLKRAPSGLRNGWFVTTNIEFFALQESLSSGVARSLLIAVAFAFLTLVFTTWNIRLSILSTISIAFLIFANVASLILLGWHLNVVESITISLTIGLAFDATLHYTIAYKLLAKGNRLLGIQMTLARIGSPVAMGAITTFLAGSIMLFSEILAYIQIGTFLMLLAFISWLYSTLFHLSLLAIFGAHHEKSTYISDWFVHLRTYCSIKHLSRQISKTDTNGNNLNQTNANAQIVHRHTLLSTNEHSTLNHQDASIRSNRPSFDESGVCLRVTSI